MELLQTIQYFFIAPRLFSPECENIVNKILTTVGFLHICYQPYVALFYHEYRIQNPIVIKQNRNSFVFLRRICICGGSLLFLRHLNVLFNESSSTLIGDSKEWVRGHQLCTYRGNYHLAWSVPLADVSYYSPGISLHSFMMFILPVLVDYKRYIWSILRLFLSGPVLASFITPNLMEQGAIWCFFSMAQCANIYFSVENDYSEDAFQEIKNDE